ncbi:MAG: 4-alpha-glucanotransferase, partial [Proteobacteria bacterium]
GEERAAAARIAEVRARHAARIERYALGQLLAHEQHAAVRARASALGLHLLADLQIGASDRDLWAWPHAFLAGYRLGAPPSRTNPEGQPWGYPLLDPADRAGARGDTSGRRLFAARLAKLWDEFDGLRVDHPHGLVDPWVYRADDPDALHAVQHGARLFGSPACPEHPALAELAIARPGDLNPDPATVRWAEDWVVRLDDEQVARYAARVDLLVATARARGRATDDVACEVLSTLPYPLARVLERHGLGRFRVTQKADLANPRDVYRSENARPEDWIMVGTHDTRPLWQLVEVWLRDGSAPARAARVAERLAAPGAERAQLADAMARDAGALALGHLAELFASPARQVMVFFADAFGFAESYNDPGTVSERNWSLRLPPSWRGDYAARLAQGRALNLPRALALACRARGVAADLVARLDADALALPRAVAAE